MLLKGKRIYFVEDNRDNIYVTIKLLSTQGAEIIVDWWASGQVWRLLGAMPLDAIILDLMLPHGRTGYEIFGEIRGLEALKNVPVVMVSAADPSEVLPRAREQGFSGFIAKPVDFENFPRQIADIIAGKPVWSEG